MIYVAVGFVLYTFATAIYLHRQGAFGMIEVRKDRERLLAEKSAWEEIWNIEEQAGLAPVRQPLPTRPDPTQPTILYGRNSGTGSAGPHFSAPEIPVRSVLKFGTTDSGPR
jgi:hypothetical protein